MGRPVLSIGTTSNLTARDTAPSANTVTLLCSALTEAEMTVRKSTAVLAEMGNGVRLGLLVLSVTSVLYSVARACRSVRLSERTTCSVPSAGSVPFVDENIHGRPPRATDKHHTSGAPPVFEKKSVVVPNKSSLLRSNSCVSSAPRTRLDTSALERQLAPLVGSVTTPSG